MYISNVVLSWTPALAGGFSEECHSWDLPYTYVQHAEEMLCAAPDKLNYLLDVISNLKRAVDHRIKHISNIHKIKKTSSFATHKNIWDTLEEIGLIRPVMLGKLLEIRNSIEHQFSNPPSAIRCTELSEFVWYFLKSTDQIAKRRSDGPILEEGDNCPFDCPYSILFEGIPENDWKPTIKACLRRELVSEKHKSEHFEVLEETVQSGYEYKVTLLGRNSGGGHSKTLDDVVASYNDEDIMLTGRLADKSVVLWFERLYFKTMMI
jgi:hypothetical protein